MDWLVDSSVGDLFRWNSDGVICRITRIRDISVFFTYMSGPQKGNHGYTDLPQDVEPYGILDRLADIQAEND